MTLTLADAVRGPVDLTEQGIVAGIFAKGVPAYSQQQVGVYARSNVYWSRLFGVRTSGCVGQQMHETGWLWSRAKPNQVDPSQFNFGGVGADNSGASGLRADTIDQGVLIYYCHLALYVYGTPDRWPEAVQQYAKWALRLKDVQWAHANKKRPDGTRLNFLGAMETYGDFVNGRWAQSDHIPIGSLENGYAAGIVRAANELLGYSKEQVTMDPTRRMIDLARQAGFEVHDVRGRLPVNSAAPYRMLGLDQVRYIIHHWTGDAFTRATIKAITGTDYGVDVISPRMSVDDEIDLLTWYANYHISRDGRSWGGIAYGTLILPSGRIYVAWPIGQRTYHAYRANDLSYAVCAPLANAAAPTPPQMAASQAVWRILAEETPEIPAGRGDIHGHVEAQFIDARNKTSCPGPVYLQALKDFRAGQSAPAPTPQPADPNAYQDPETRHWIVNAPGAPILDFWRDGGVERWGRPKGGMKLREDGVYEQLMENVLIESWPAGFGHHRGPHVRIGGLGQRYEAALLQIEELRRAA